MLNVWVQIDDHEWLFRLEEHQLPSIGDKILLWHSIPGKDAQDFVEAEIVKRVWDLNYGIEVMLLVVLDSAIPDGHIADCKARPAADYFKRSGEYKDARDPQDET